MLILLRCIFPGCFGAGEKFQYDRHSWTIWDDDFSQKDLRANKFIARWMEPWDDTAVNIVSYWPKTPKMYVLMRFTIKF